MIVLSGASLVLPDRLLSSGTLLIEGDRIAEIRRDALTPGHAHQHFAFHGHYIVPGFVDLHVHGVDGFDTLDHGHPIAAIAERLPRYGVTAFCPTTVACAPSALRGALDQVRRAQTHPVLHGARVLPAHLESNFLNPEYAGAQPVACLRSPAGSVPDARVPEIEGEFSGADILAEIERAAPQVAIVTLAPELPGGLDLIGALASRGHLVSLGHSAASYDVACAAIAAGARHATHLFNRMPPLNHRAPGLAGAVLQAEEVAAELICDGFHVHPALVRMAVALKTPSRVMAITDATAVAGLPVGSTGRLGGQPIVSGESAAYLTDGTVAGSTLTMDRAFRMLVQAGLSLPHAATMCSTTAASAIGLDGQGVLAAGNVADLVVLDADFTVVQTYVAGQLAYARNASASRTTC